MACITVRKLYPATSCKLFPVDLSNLKHEPYFSRGLTQRINLNPSLISQPPSTISAVLLLCWRIISVKFFLDFGDDVWGVWRERRWPYTDKKYGATRRRHLAWGLACCLQCSPLRRPWWTHWGEVVLSFWILLKCYLSLKWEGLSPNSQVIKKRAQRT